MRRVDACSIRELTMLQLDSYEATECEPKSLGRVRWEATLPRNELAIPLRTELISSPSLLLPLPRRFLKNSLASLRLPWHP